ncbi:MAG: phosphatidylserine decarboxylase [Ruminococcaceae bacterium]|nr:phosphatidylserine decarboxylase [Oscillospiraceae bacterium]
MRKTNPFDPKLDSGFLKFVYMPYLGAPLRFLMTRKWVTKLGGAYMNTHFSARRISKFIKANAIDMSDYESREFTCFNDFFTRKILTGKRPFSSDPLDLCSPADSKLTTYPCTEEELFTVKGTPYTLTELIGDAATAKEFVGGTVLVFRLCVDDYHRYAFFDSGKVSVKPRYIKGAFHTVRPIAFTNERRVFCRNAREVTVLETENFGKALQIEVGAMMVGKIVNHDVTAFRRGDEKGYFEFGGSTVVLVLQKDAASLEPCFLENTANGLETKVACGETIGKSTKQQGV